MNVKAGQAYNVTVDLSKFAPSGTEFTGYILAGAGTSGVAKFVTGSTVTLNGGAPIDAPIVVTGITDANAKYTSISFSVIFEAAIDNVLLTFTTTSF